MDGVDLLVLEEISVVAIAPFDAMSLADLGELLLRPLADGHKLSMRMPLVDGDELGAEAEADDRGADLPRRGGGRGQRGVPGVRLLGSEGDLSPGSGTCVGCRR